MNFRHLLLRASLKSIGGSMVYGSRNVIGRYGVGMKT
jgi:hypothetical protein